MSNITQNTNLSGKVTQFLSGCQAHQLETPISVIASDRHFLVLRKIMTWQARNEREGNNLIDGYYWTYNTLAKMAAKDYPGWPARRVRSILDDLQAWGWITSCKPWAKQWKQTKAYRVNIEGLVSAIARKFDLVKPYLLETDLGKRIAETIETMHLSAGVTSNCQPLTNDLYTSNTSSNTDKYRTAEKPPSEVDQKSANPKPRKKPDRPKLKASSLELDKDSQGWLNLPVIRRLASQQRERVSKAKALTMLRLKKWLLQHYADDLSIEMFRDEDNQMLISTKDVLEMPWSEFSKPDGPMSVKMMRDILADALDGFQAEFNQEMIEAFQYSLNAVDRGELPQAIA